MAAGIQIIVLLLFVLGLLLLLAGYRIRGMVRPTGHVDYLDSDSEAYVPHGPLIATKQNLAGTPHGLLRATAEGQTIPIIVLDAPAPDTLSSDVRMQMGVLCRLTELVYDQNVPYGLVRYRDRDLSVNWTPGLAQDLEWLLAEIQQDTRAQDVPRSHQSPKICADCIVQHECDQALE